MKYSIFVLAITLFCLSSCDKRTPEEKILSNFDCEFMQVDGDNDGLIDEDEAEFMQLCINEVYDSKEEIEDNLIGEWILVGHGEGWVSTISQPCAYAIFEKDVVTYKFENASVDTIITIEYEIKESQSPSSKIFSIDVGDLFVDGLRITQFSPMYMFGDATARDGNMYLYEKVK